MPRFMRTLVTGGAGFIGSNLVDALVDRGDEVTIVDDISTGKRENLTEAVQNGAELVESDIRDAQAMLEVFPAEIRDVEEMSTSPTPPSAT